MILYLDTSAIVKLYVEEEGSESLRRDTRGVTRATSALAYVEPKSALSRRRRTRDLTEEAFLRHSSEFERDWKTFAPAAVNGGIIQRAGELVDRFALKAYDAIHLSTAEFVQREAGSAVTSVCFDRALSSAASALRFPLLSASA